MKNTRRLCQAGFLALTLVGVFLVRGNAERWCPFGGVEALYTYWSEGNMICSLGVTNFYVLIGVLLSVLIMRRVFCGYLCPVGALSEWSRKPVQWLGIKPVRVPQSVEKGLASLKYVVLGLILYITWIPGELHFRAYDPCYALISRHGEDITYWAYIIAGAIVLFSLFLTVPFCRWFCPLAAVLNPLSRFGLTRIQRDKDACIDCGKCSRACPMNISVHEHDQVTSARCTSCMECVSACPVTDKPVLQWGPPKRLSQGGWSRAAVVSLLLVIMGGIVFSAYAAPMPSFVKEKDPNVPVPAETEQLDLEVKGIHCRGSAQLFCYFLFRDDLSEVTGHLKVEAWPAPDPRYARVRITYDPSETDPLSIKEAITEPYFDELQSFERMSPFVIKGYEPWAEL